MFTKAWHGEEKLRIIYWYYAFWPSVVVKWGVIFAMVLIYGDAITNVRSDPPWAIVLHIILLLWIGWVGILLWRCAFNVDWLGWGYIIRGLVLVGVPCNVFEILVLLFVLVKDPSVISDTEPNGLRMETCAQIVASYAKKNGVEPKQYALDHPNMEQSLVDMGKCIKR